MSDTSIAFIFLVIFLCFFVFIIGVGVGLGETDHFKEEAFKRGYMIECLGKTGYYWECEED